MRESSLLGHGLLAVGATVLAYSAWQAPASSTITEEVVIIPGSLENLTEVSWEEERHDVTVKRAGEDVMVTVQSRPRVVDVPKKDAPKEGEPQEQDDGKADTNEATEDETKPEEPQLKPKTYPGTKQATKMLDGLAPLKASRSLGAVPEERLADLGLDTPKGKLTLRFGADVEHSVDIGKTTYGSGDLYARGKDGKVYLLRATVVSKLRYGGSSLLDRNALGVEREKIERAIIQNSTGEREVVYRHAEDKSKAFFADPAEPDTKLNKLSGWLDRILRLRVSDLSEGAVPTAPPGVTVEVLGSEGSLGKVSLWEPGDAKQATALTSRFPGPVLVSRANAKAILRDAPDAMAEGK